MSVLVNTNVKSFKNFIPTKRRIIQLYCALLYNAQLKGFVTGQIYEGKTKAVCVPGFNCYSCPGAVGACPLGSIQNALAQSHNRIGFYVIGIILLYGMLLGRTICGWLCPLGMIQELLHKIPTPKIPKSRITRALTYLKYVILAVFCAAVPMWYGFTHGMAVPGFCKYICPAGTFEGAMGLLSSPNNRGFFSMLGILFTRKFIIMLFIGLLCVFCYRAFCRFICPLGAIYGMFSRLAVIGVKVDLNRCNSCGSCVRACKMDVRKVGDHECIHCAQCIAVCPQKALSLKAGDYVLKAPEGGMPGESKETAVKRAKTEKILWGIAIAVLCFAIVWFNFLDPSGKKKAKATSPKTVTETVKDDPKEEPSGDASKTSSGAETDAGDKGADGASGGAGDTTEETAEVISETGGEGAGSASSFESDAPIGYEVGEQLEDFTAECFDGTTFHLKDYRGKPVIINLWATYCGPCVQEIPHFIELNHKHQDDIGIIAVHSPIVVDEVDEYLENKDWDLHITLDNDETDIFGKVNGTTVMPQTIVLNRKGEVIYNKIGSVTPELLEQLYEHASEQ